MHFIEVRFEAGIVVVSIGKAKQLIEVRSPEVVHVHPPAFDDCLNFSTGCAFWHGRDHILIDLPCLRP